MGRSATQNKWAKKEEAKQAAFTVRGGPLNGYEVVSADNVTVWSGEKMWDAINERDRLLHGGTVSALSTEV